MALNLIFKILQRNVVADALSRKEEDMKAFICAIYIIQPKWVTKSRNEWKKDKEVWTLIQNLQQDPSTSNTFSWKNDSLRYKDHHIFVRIPN